MVTNKSTLAKIKNIIERHYAKLTVSLLGREVFSAEELAVLAQLGIDTSPTASLLSLVYNNSLMNSPTDNTGPQNIEGMKAQQNLLGQDFKDVHHDYTRTNLNDKTRLYIEKLKQDVSTRIDSIIRENNDDYKRKIIGNPVRSTMVDELMQESSLGKVKQKLRDSAKDGNRDWEMISVTEISNALGLGSADRIVADNVNADLDEVYVYRIITKDSKTCKYCRRFYLDDDDAPKLYRMSTLLGNGTNYGKKAEDWRPVTVATHPRERCSPMIELKPGWGLTTSGSQTYMGLEKWRGYINKKLQK